MECWGLYRTAENRSVRPKLRLPLQRASKKQVCIRASLQRCRKESTSAAPLGVEVCSFCSVFQHVKDFAKLSSPDPPNSRLPVRSRFSHEHRLLGRHGWYRRDRSKIVTANLREGGAPALGDRARRTDRLDAQERQGSVRAQ